MVKILMRRGKGLKTLHLGKRISKLSPEADRIVTSKTPVRRLQRKAPAEAMTDEKYASQFTNNPNPKYQPTGVHSNAGESMRPDAGAGSVKRVRVPLKLPLGKGAGHGKTIKRPASKWKRGRLS